MTRPSLAELVLLVAEEIDSLAGELGGQLHVVDAELADVRSQARPALRSAGNHRAVNAGALAENPQAAPARGPARSSTGRCGASVADSERPICRLTSEIGEYVADFREFLAEGSIPERKALIRNFVESIEVDDRDAILTYTIPMPSDGVTKERTPVLDFVQSGPPTRTDLRTPPLQPHLGTV